MTGRNKNSGSRRRDGKSKSTSFEHKRGGAPRKNVGRRPANMPKFDDKIRLNKFISNAGICSRREADVLISTGVVSVNGKIITELGYRVNPTDVVKYDGITVKHEKKEYVLINKPVDFGIYFDNSSSRKTVYQFLEKASKAFLLPVGKLDKSACGLMLYTNDSDLEKKLTHPQYKASQLFHVVLNKPMLEEDLAKLTSGLYVDDKMFSAEEASYVKGKESSEIGVRVFSNKSNMVKLMVGKLGYEIVKLDRVEYAGLTKKDLPRGHYRVLSEREVGFLKMS